MSLEYHSRNLAEALRWLEELEAFKHSAAFDETLSVTWTRAAATRGYKEISKSISSVVSERWNELRDAAINKARDAVERAKKDLLAELGKDGER